jgi:hypothetical protein
MISHTIDSDLDGSAVSPENHPVASVLQAALTFALILAPIPHRTILHIQRPSGQ